MRKYFTFAASLILAGFVIPLWAAVDMFDKAAPTNMRKAGGDNAFEKHGKKGAHFSQKDQKQLKSQLNGDGKIGSTGKDKVPIAIHKDQTFSKHSEAGNVKAGYLKHGSFYKEQGGKMKVGNAFQKAKMGDGSVHAADGSSKDAAKVEMYQKATGPGGGAGNQLPAVRTNN